MTAFLTALASHLPRPNGRRSFTLSTMRAKLAGLPAVLQALPATRFAHASPQGAAACLALLAIALVWTSILAFRPESGAAVLATEPDRGDVALYEAVVSRLVRGQGYYEAVVAEHRARGYPLRPFPTVRLPTLAILQSTLGFATTAVCLIGLTTMAMAAFARRLCGQSVVAATALSVCTAVGLGLMPGLFPASSRWHEAWAGVLIVLSLACCQPDRWRLSVVLGFAAVCLRELALPFLCAMGSVAVFERRMREAAAWFAAVLAFAVILFVHAHWLSAMVLESDAASPGWIALNGWPFVLSMLGNCSIFALLPIPVASVLACLALVGWLAWPSALGLRGAMLVFGYVGAFLIVGRTENVYWGFLWAPLLVPGLLAAPAAIRDLLRACFGPNPRPLRS